KPQDSETFFQYNWTPPVTCHSDQLSWWGDGYLRYVRTTDACGNATKVVDYFTTNTPIILLPRVWHGGRWHRSGSSPEVVIGDGQVRCTGTNAWVASILGVQRIAPGQYALHWRTDQTTTWATGDGTWDCLAGTVTGWREDYWLVNNLPGPHGP